MGIAILLLRLNRETCVNFLRIIIKKMSRIMKIKDMSTTMYRVKKWVFNASKFNRYGLYHDDTLNEDSVVSEALKRVPQHIIDERTYRIQVALQLYIQRSILPREEWVSFEENREKGYYLQPYIEEIEEQIKEQNAWFKQ